MSTDGCATFTGMTCISTTACGETAGLWPRTTAAASWDTALDAASQNAVIIQAALASTCSVPTYSAGGLTLMPIGRITIAAGPTTTMCQRITIIHSFTDGPITPGQGRFTTIGAGSAIPGIGVMDTTSTHIRFIPAPRCG